MADGITTNLGLTKPEVGLSYNTWGEKINTDLDLLDAALWAIEPQQLVGGGVGLLAGVDTENFAARTLAVGSGLSIANPTGGAGNPAISLNPTGLTAKTSPVDADEVLITDSAAAFVPKKATRAALFTGTTFTAPRRTLSNLGAVSGSIGLDLSGADTFLVERSSGALGLGFNNLPSGKMMDVTIVLINGSNLTTFGTQTWLWPGGATPIFTTSGTDIIKVLIVGTSTVYAWRVAEDVR